jgi:cobyrinic acid a,c-diamide synthase
VRIGRSIEAQVDLDMLLAIAADSSVPPAPAEPPGAIAPLDQPLRIAVARDEAFGFYYPGDLQAMAAAGAELIAVDTLRDTTLPAVDGLFIGGGFPESCMQKLQANVSLRGAIRQAIEDGLPVYAECGGLMYLSRSLSWKGSRCEMVGSIPADTVMHERPQGRGYVRLAPTASHPWGISAGETVEICAHEFHYSALDGLEAGDGFAFQVMRGTGIDGAHDGFVYKNLLACYTHQRTTRGNRWTEDFLRFVSACKSRRCPTDNTPSTQRG